MTTDFHLEDSNHDFLLLLKTILKKYYLFIIVFISISIACSITYYKTPIYYSAESTLIYNFPVMVNTITPLDRNLGVFTKNILKDNYILKQKTSSEYCINYMTNSEHISIESLTKYLTDINQEFRNQYTFIIHKQNELLLSMIANTEMDNEIRNKNLKINQNVLDAIQDYGHLKILEAFISSLEEEKKDIGFLYIIPRHFINPIIDIISQNDTIESYINSRNIADIYEEALTCKEKLHSSIENLVSKIKFSDYILNNSEYYYTYMLRRSCCYRYMLQEVLVRNNIILNDINSIDIWKSNDIKITTLKPSLSKTIFKILTYTFGGWLLIIFGILIQLKLKGKLLSI